MMDASESFETVSACQGTDYEIPGDVKLQTRPDSVVNTISALK
jgi:hypothetical protein